MSLNNLIVVSPKNHEIVKLWRKNSVKEKAGVRTINANIRTFIAIYLQFKKIVFCEYSNDPAILFLHFNTY